MYILHCLEGRLLTRDIDNRLMPPGAPEQLSEGDLLPPSQPNPSKICDIEIGLPVFISLLVNLKSIVRADNEDKASTVISKYFS